MTWNCQYGGVQEEVRYYPYCKLCDEDLTGNSYDSEVDAESAFEDHMLFAHEMKYVMGRWVPA